ncbi:hypothetical protein OG738_25525 [Amycolatopsis sp. NBC_01488]|nr:hypothetical protein [Amycolatopsis sp. NBC_01488]
MPHRPGAVRTPASGGAFLGWVKPDSAPVIPMRTTPATVSRLTTA